MEKYMDSNILINHIILTVDCILKDKNLPQNLLNYLHFVTYGMICKYGGEYIEDIYATLENIEFINDDFSQFKNVNISNNFFYKNPSNNNYLFKSVDFGDGFPSLNLKYELLFKDIDNSVIRTLEYLSYQVNYIFLKRKRKISLSSGLKLTFDYLRNSVTNNEVLNDEKVLDKIFNILQTEDIIKHILELRGTDIKNEFFNETLCKLNDINYDSYKVDGLDALVNLIRPLYKCEDIKKLVNIYDGADSLEKEFDTILGKNSFKKVTHKIEMLSNMISRCENGISHNYYELSLEYLNLRNNYINKYITKKYA